MQNSLRIYSTILSQLRKWLPRERTIYLLPASC